MFFFHIKENVSYCIGWICGATIIKCINDVVQGSGCGATLALCWTRASLGRTLSWGFLATQTVPSTTLLWVTWSSSRAPATLCSTSEPCTKSPTTPAGWQTGLVCHRGPMGRWPAQTVASTCSENSASGDLTRSRCESPERASGPRTWAGLGAVVHLRAITSSDQQREPSALDKVQFVGVSWNEEVL